MGGTFGVAIFGTILNSQLARNLDELLPAGTTPAGGSASLLSSPERIHALPQAIREPVIEAFVRSLDTVFLAGVPVTIVAFLLALAIKELPLRAHVPPPSDARQDATEQAVLRDGDGSEPSGGYARSRSAGMTE
jgi:hypothetical protein